MNSTNFLEAPPILGDFREKAEAYITNQYADQIREGHFHGLSFGRNKDSAIGQRGGFRIAGNYATMASALVLDVPRRMIGESILGEEAKKKTIITRVSDAVKALAVEKVNQLMTANPQLDKVEAQARVADSLRKIGFFDKTTGMFTFERVRDKALGSDGRVKDSVLSGLQTPIWDIAQIQKVFSQPFLRLYAEGLISKVGIPNIWANLVQVFTSTFEGYARLANVAKGTGDFNTSIGVKNRTSTIIAEMFNIVMDYEAPNPNDVRVGSQDGNWLTNASIGERDGYANLMTEQLANLLWYFGDAASGFDGLTQIANRDGTYTLYPATQPPAEYLWQNDGAGTGTGPVNQTVGADLLLVLNHMIGEKLQALSFLPVEVHVNVSPILYKVLKFSMLSKVYNQNNPMSIIRTAFEHEGKIQGTMAVESFNQGYLSFTMTPDPALMPNTPFNPTVEDLTFITFPTFQNAMENGALTDLVMAPTAIDKMILPSAPGYRQGVVRTMLKRIGSIIAPVQGTVHVISGMGINSRYTPPSPST
jgi:hypothetical protein